MADQTVLVVEDEENLAVALRYNLVREGYSVRLANDGSAGLEIARSTSPDLIILDVMLPGISGYDICREIRRESDVPILMLTARGEEVDKVVGLELGADDYVTKPFSVRELMARRPRPAPPAPQQRGWRESSRKRRNRATSKSTTSRTSSVRTELPSNSSRVSSTSSPCWWRTRDGPTRAISCSTHCGGATT